MAGGLRERIERVEHWELITLMLLTGAAILTLYTVGVLLFWGLLTFGNVQAGIVIGLVLAVLVAGVQYWRNMREMRAEGNELTVREVPWLHEEAEELAAELGIEKPDLRVVSDPTPNAFAIGRREDGLVFFHSGLLESMNRDEVTAILAHEMAHLRNRDSILMTISMSIRRLLVRGAAALTLVIVMIAQMIAAADDENPSQARRERQARIQAGAVAVVTTAVSGLVLIFSRLLSRYREYVADLTAARAMDDPAPMRSALRSLDAATAGGRKVDNDEASSLYIINSVDGLLSTLFATHPNLERRIQTLDETFDTERDPSPTTTGATLGTFTKFGLTGAPVLILLGGLTMTVLVVAQLATGSSVSSLLPDSGLLAVVLALFFLAVVVSVVAFPWAMLFADGGEAEFGFVAVVCTLAVLFVESVLGTLSFSGVLALGGYLGLMGISAVQLNRIRTHLSDADASEG